MKTLNKLLVFGHLVAIVVSFPLTKDPPPFNVAEEVYVTELYNVSVCVIDGIPYEDGEFIPTIDPCESCICHPPGFACKMIKCKKPPQGCIEKAKKLDDCCPRVVCDESLVNNLVYRVKNENDTFEDELIQTDNGEGGLDTQELSDDVSLSTEDTTQTTLLTSAVSKEHLVTSAKTEATTMLVNYSIKLIVDDLTKENNATTESSVTEDNGKVDENTKTPVKASEESPVTENKSRDGVQDDVPKASTQESTTSGVKSATDNVQEKATSEAQVSTAATSIDHSNETTETYEEKIISPSENPKEDKFSEDSNKSVYSDEKSENAESVTTLIESSSPATNEKETTASGINSTDNPISKGDNTSPKASDNDSKLLDIEKEPRPVSTIQPETARSIDDKVTQFIGIFEEITPIPDENGIKEEAGLITNKEENQTDSVNGGIAANNRESNETNEDISKPSGPIIFVETEPGVTLNEHGMRPRETENATTTVSETITESVTEENKSSNNPSILETSTEQKTTETAVNGIVKTNNEETNCNSSEKSVELINISKESVLPKEVLDALLDEVAARLRGGKGNDSKLENGTIPETKLEIPTTEKSFVTEGERDEPPNDEEVEDQNVEDEPSKINDEQTDLSEAEKQEFIKKVEGAIQEFISQFSTPQTVLIMTGKPATHAVTLIDLFSKQNDELPERVTEESALDTKLELTTIISASVDFREQSEDKELELVNVTQGFNSETSTPDIATASPNSELVPETTITTSESTENREKVNKEAESSNDQESALATTQSPAKESSSNVDSIEQPEKISNPESTSATSQSDAETKIEPEQIRGDSDFAEKTQESSENALSTGSVESTPATSQSTVEKLSAATESSLSTSNSEDENQELKTATQKSLELIPDHSESSPTTQAEVSKSLKTDLPTTDEPNAIVGDNKSVSASDLPSSDMPTVATTEKLRHETDSSSSSQDSAADGNQEVNKSQDEVKEKATTLQFDSEMSSTPKETQPTTQDDTSGGKFETTTIQITLKETTLKEVTGDGNAVEIPQQSDVEVKEEPTKYLDNSTGAIESEEKIKDLKKLENLDTSSISSVTEGQKMEQKDAEVADSVKSATDGDEKVSEMQDTNKISTAAAGAAKENNNEMSTTEVTTTESKIELLTVGTILIENGKESSSPETTTTETSTKVSKTEETSKTDEPSTEGSKILSPVDTSIQDKETTTSSSTIAPTTIGITTTTTTQPDSKTQESGFTSPWTVVMETIFSSVQPSSYDAPEESQNSK